MDDVCSPFTLPLVLSPQIVLIDGGKGYLKKKNASHWIVIIIFLSNIGSHHIVLLPQIVLVDGGRGYWGG